MHAVRAHTPKDKKVSGVRALGLGTNSEFLFSDPREIEALNILLGFITFFGFFSSTMVLKNEILPFKVYYARSKRRELMKVYLIYFRNAPVFKQYCV